MIKLKNLLNEVNSIKGKNGYTLEFTMGSGKGSVYTLWYTGKAGKVSDTKTIDNYQYRTIVFDNKIAYSISKPRYVSAKEFGKLLKKEMSPISVNSVANIIELKYVKQIMKKNFPNIKYKFYSDDNFIEIKNDLSEIWKDGKSPHIDHCQVCYNEEHEGKTGELKKFELIKKYDMYNKNDTIDICQDCHKKLKRNRVIK